MSGDKGYPIWRVRTIEVRRGGSDLPNKVATVEGKLGAARKVFIAGATGYMGSRLAAELVRRGHSVTGLVRSGAEVTVITAPKPIKPPR